MFPNIRIFQLEFSVFRFKVVAVAPPTKSAHTVNTILCAHTVNTPLWTVLCVHLQRGRVQANTPYYFKGQEQKTGTPAPAWIQKRVQPGIKSETLGTSDITWSIRQKHLVPLLTQTLFGRVCRTCVRILVVRVMFAFFTLNRSVYSSTSSTLKCPRWFCILERYKLCGHKASTQAATLYQLSHSSLL